MSANALHIPVDAQLAALFSATPMEKREKTLRLLKAFLGPSEPVADKARLQ